MVADNTDGIGLVTDLTTNAGVSLGGKRVLVLGAGDIGAVAEELLTVLAAKTTAEAGS